MTPTTHNRGRDYFTTPDPSGRYGQRIAAAPFEQDRRSLAWRLCHAAIRLAVGARR